MAAISTSSVWRRCKWRRHRSAAPVVRIRQRVVVGALTRAEVVHAALQAPGVMTMAEVRAAEALPAAVPRPDPEQLRLARLIDERVGVQIDRLIDQLQARGWL